MERYPYFTRFIVTKHKTAKECHFDLRIARENVGMSWAIEKFPKRTHDEVFINRTKNHSICLFDDPSVIDGVTMVDSGKCDVYQWEDPIVVHLRGKIFKGFYSLRLFKFNRWVIRKESTKCMVEKFQIQYRGSIHDVDTKKHTVLQE